MGINDGDGKEQPSKHALVIGQESGFFLLLCVCVSERWRDRRCVNDVVHIYVHFMYYSRLYRW